MLLYLHHEGIAVLTNTNTFVKKCKWLLFYFTSLND
jgi:hypothetical protein